MKIIERDSEYIGVIKTILNCETTNYLEIGFSGYKCSLYPSLSFNHITL